MYVLIMTIQCCQSQYVCGLLRSVAGCFAVLRQLRSIRRSVPSHMYQSLVVAPVLSWLDYGNATLARLPASLLNRLQSVLNAAARLIAGLKSSSLGAYYRCSRQFSLAPSTRAHQVQTVIVYQALHGNAPQYLSDRLQYVADLPTRRRGGPPVTACHCRRSLYCCCWPTTLEQST